METGTANSLKPPPELRDALPSFQVLVGAQRSEQLFVSVAATRGTPLLFLLFSFFLFFLLFPKEKLLGRAHHLTLF